MSTVKRQGHSLAVGAGFVVVGCLLGVGVTLLFTMSPGEAAGQRAAPQLPIPTVQVVSQQLRDAVEAPCSHSAVTSQALPPLSTGDYRARVVTSIEVKADDDLKSGTVVGSVSGRAIISFTTAVPFFRDLKVGDRGSDVEALREGLVAAGKLSDAGDVFDAKTAAVVKQIYAGAGLTGVVGFDVDSAWGVPPGSHVASVEVGVGDVIQADTVLVTAQGDDGDWVCQLPAGLNVDVGDALRASVGGEMVDATVAGVDADGEKGATTVTVTLPGQVDGRAVVFVTVVAAQSDGPVLSVPASAIFTSPAGGPQVRIVHDSQVTPVEVTVGVAAGGWIQISGHGIGEGDSVQLRGPG